MIVYHGSVQTVEHPDIAHSRTNLDFGRGFYVTSHRDKAENWAMRRALRAKKTAILNVYEFSVVQGFEVRRFPDDRDWLEFVCACRRGKQQDEFDVIIGQVADDRVYDAVDMYYRGIWDAETTLAAIKYYPKNDQYCLASQQAIDAMLVFSDAIEVNA